jgi:hypothetical protein
MKIYGQGSAPDCRRHVQKLNTVQGEQEQLMAEKVIDDYDFGQDEVEIEEELLQEVCQKDEIQEQSKWEKFVEVQNNG